MTTVTVWPLVDTLGAVPSIETEILSIMDAAGASAERSRLGGPLP